LSPTFFLKPLTPEARAALGGDALEVTQFPFRVGRESRIMSRLMAAITEMRRSEAKANNDLYLEEPGNLLNVSREHFLIDYREGGYVLVDRESACGTLVEGEQIGADRQGGSKQLADQDVIIVGTSESRFVFKFVISEHL